MRPIGLHLRLNDTLLELAQRAAAMHLPIFQCFFIQQESNTFINPSKTEIAAFVTQWRSRFGNLFLHGSYWINLANENNRNRIVLREIDLAKQLEFTHIILHPGACANRDGKQHAIASISKNLNALFKKEHEIKIVLENTAHAGLSIGGDLQDFYQIKKYLNHPEKLLFCIDTAHAYSYQYDLATILGQTDFFAKLEKTIGFESIALLHLNDTNQLCGSRIDQHEPIGTGAINFMLKNFIQYPSLRNIPVILELPVLNTQTELEMVRLVRSWDTQ